MKQFLSRRLTLLQTVAEISGLGCLSAAGFLVARPLGFAILGLSLLLVGNVRLGR